MSEPRPILPIELQSEFSAMPADEQAALAEAWLLAGDAGQVDERAKREAWDRIQAGMRPRRLDRAPARRLPLRLVPVRSFAAAAAVVALLTTTLVLQPWAVRHEVGRGMAATVFSLPDGSKAELAAGSTLRYLRWSPRSLALDGEAFFDVVRTGDPFVVETFSARIEVLGTAFNVRARAGEQAAATRVDLVRGSVRVASRDIPGPPVELRPGQGTRVDRHAAPSAPAESDLEAATSWRSGGMAFAHAPIGDVIDEIGRRFNVRIAAVEDIRLGTISFFRHSSATVEELLGDLSDSAGLRFRRTAQGFELFVP